MQLLAIVSHPLRTRYRLVCAPSSRQIRALFQLWPSTRLSKASCKDMLRLILQRLCRLILRRRGCLPERVEDLHHASWTRNFEPPASAHRTDNMLFRELVKVIPFFEASATLVWIVRIRIEHDQSQLLRTSSPTRPTASII